MRWRDLAAALESLLPTLKNLARFEAQCGVLLYPEGLEYSSDSPSRVKLSLWLPATLFARQFLVWRCWNTAGVSPFFVLGGGRQ